MPSIAGAPTRRTAARTAETTLDMTRGDMHRTWWRSSVGLTRARCSSTPRCTVRRQLLSLAPVMPRGSASACMCTVVHNPIEAPDEFLSTYENSQPGWCTKKQKIAAMASVADNVTRQLVGALQGSQMWARTVLVFSSVSPTQQPLCDPHCQPTTRLRLTGQRRRLWRLIKLPSARP